MIELKDIKITDAHCHPFNPSKEGSDDFRLDFNLYHQGATIEMARNVIPKSSMG